jgi:hypothetical protein
LPVMAAAIPSFRGAAGSPRIRLCPIQWSTRFNSLSDFWPLKRQERPSARSWGTGCLAQYESPQWGHLHLWPANGCARKPLVLMVHIPCLPIAS